MGNGDITFKPLAFIDIQLFTRWFAQPHVAPWWPAEAIMDYKALLAKYMPRTESGHSVSMSVIYTNNHPIGFIQSYDVSNINENVWAAETAGTYSFDICIGDPDYVGKGYGTNILRQYFALLVIQRPVKRLVVTVDPLNIAAIKCYQKIGFSSYNLPAEAGSVVKMSLMGSEIL